MSQAFQFHLYRFETKNKFCDFRKINIASLKLYHGHWQMFASVKPCTHCMVNFCIGYTTKAPITNGCVDMVSGDVCTTLFTSITSRGRFLNSVGFADTRPGGPLNGRSLWVQLGTAQLFKLSSWGRSIVDKCFVDVSRSVSTVRSLARLPRKAFWVLILFHAINR